MKFHIVRDGETIREIMFLYSITEDELKEENRHIRVWDRLIPGTKLKVPVLSEADDNDILQMEPFIEDYYPKDINLEGKEVISNALDEELIVDNQEKIEEDNIINNTVATNDVVLEDVILEKDTNINETKKDIRESEREDYINKPRRQNNYKHNIIYYPYYVYYPIYSPYFFRYKKGK